MRRFFQYLSCGSAVLLALTAFLAAQAPDAIPKVDLAKSKPYTEAVPESEYKFDMVPIPGGTFLMGSPPTEPGRTSEEGPQHLVTIRPFWMGKTEVTWEEYDVFRKVMGVESHEENERRIKADADAITGPTNAYADETFGHGKEGKPCLCITHHAAMMYCRWLSAKTGMTYRLPTEAEWEYACRAGTKTAYHFGDDPKKLGEYEWFAENCEDTVQPVGKKKPNPWGLYDMHGNVAEWCIDQYHKDAYAKFPADKPTLWPVFIPGPDRFPHVARGGSWLDDPAKCRSAVRRGSDKTWIKRDPQRPQSIWWLTDAELVGFRVVRPYVEQDNLKGLRSKVTRQSR